MPEASGDTVVDGSTATTVAELARGLVDRALGTDERIIVGVVGAPGTGKSTLTHAIADLLGDDLCRVVPLDGFHLGQGIINDTELAGRKGAPDTFDVGGYLSLLRRLRANTEETIYAPVYRRELEEPIAASVAVPRTTRIILTEGNYLLLAHDGWELVRDLLDDAWYVDTPDSVRRERLVARHIRFGKPPELARAWVDGSDERNAELVAATRSRADRVIAWSD